MKRTEKMVTITPEQAEKYLLLNTFAGQRNIRENHVLQLAQKMEDGRFHVGNIAFVHRDGETMLADGQHQLTACPLAKKPFKAVQQDYYLNGEDDAQSMARVFSQFNVDSARTRAEIAWIFGCQLGWESWPRRVVSLLSSALAALQTGAFLASASMMSKDDAAALLAQNTKVCEWVHEMGIGENRHLRRMATVAAMIATFRKSQKAATEFWSAVRDGDGLARNDPRFVLREYLKDASLQGGLKNPVQRQISDGRAMFSKCVHAWNAWREDRTTPLKYFPKAEIPKPV